MYVLSSPQGLTLTGYIPMSHGSMSPVVIPLMVSGNSMYALLKFGQSSHPAGSISCFCSQASPSVFAFGAQ